jgi:hypothetical protein
MTSLAINSSTMEKANERHQHQSQSSNLKAPYQLFDFEAAEPMFREIRKTLNDMAVKRSQPIKKVTSMSQVMAINV